MLNKYKRISAMILLLLVHTLVSSAQETDLKWGLSSQIKIQEILQNNKVEDIYSYNQESVTLGVFVQYKNLDVKFEFLTRSASVDLRYFVWNKVFVSLKGSWDGHNYEFDNGENYSDCSYVDDINVYSYLGGFGYEKTIFGRLKCQGTMLGGVITSSKNTESSIILRSNDSNVRARKTDTYQLEPSFVYGGSIELEWLPNPSKNRLRPIAPFASLQITGTNKSRTYRKVSIEEWVEGNVVYQEEINPNDRLYDFVYVNVRMGIKLYLKK
ncbi:hypothetical protein [Labilibaculum manganireducens]|uniref:hypothetical protein n=1 Tax=Labilibaculum manganireducens TaxID=1940525 RepID=UPI0029F54BDF|nr:hypothetical protein [Labilibaculum manganireducens]